MSNFAGEQGGVLPSGNSFEYGFYAADPDHPDWKSGGTTMLYPQSDNGAQPKSERVTVIHWQNGPVLYDEPEVEGLDSIPRPNGATLEDVIELTMERLRSFNMSPARCRENSLALTKLEEALHWLNARTARRQRQGTEGHYVEREGGEP